MSRRRKFVVKSNTTNGVSVGFGYVIACGKCGVNPFAKKQEMIFSLNSNGDIEITEASRVNKKAMIDNWNTRTPNERGAEK